MDNLLPDQNLRLAQKVLEQQKTINDCRASLCELIMYISSDGYSYAEILGYLKMLQKKMEGAK